jgi:hypothetical protein
MNEIFGKQWVRANLEFKRDYILDDVYQGVSDRLQRRVEEQLPDFPALSARHDADQAVISTLTGDVAKLKIELAKLKAEMQVMALIGSDEQYAQYIRQMHGIQTEATK